MPHGGSIDSTNICICTPAPFGDSVEGFEDVGLAGAVFADEDVYAGAEGELGVVEDGEVLEAGAADRHGNLDHLGKVVGIVTRAVVAVKNCAGQAGRAAGLLQGAEAG